MTNALRQLRLHRLQRQARGEGYTMFTKFVPSQSVCSDLRARAVQSSRNECALERSESTRLVRMNHPPNKSPPNIDVKSCYQMLSLEHSDGHSTETGVCGSIHFCACGIRVRTCCACRSSWMRTIAAAVWEANSVWRVLAVT
jgi:hypothetical protein